MSDEIPKEYEVQKEKKEDTVDDDDPGTDDFHGFEDCAGDKSSPAVVALPTGKTRIVLGSSIIDSKLLYMYKDS